LSVCEIGLVDFAGEESFKAWGEVCVPYLG